MAGPAWPVSVCRASNVVSGSPSMRIDPPRQLRTAIAAYLLVCLLMLGLALTLPVARWWGG